MIAILAAAVLYGVAILATTPAISQAKSDTNFRINEANGTRRIEVVSNAKTIMHSPAEGLWSVATDWQDGWPTAWHHASPDAVTKEGEWTVISGKINLPGGQMLLRDAYRLESGVVRGTRRWTWTGKEPLKKCTLSIRWTVPNSRNAKPMMPGIVLYGNPAGEKTGNHAVTVHAGNPNDKSFFEEHRFSAPWESIEWQDGNVPPTKPRT